MANDPNNPSPTDTPDFTAAAEGAEKYKDAMLELASSVQGFVQKAMNMNGTQSDGIHLNERAAAAVDLVSIAVLKASDAFADFTKNTEQLQTFTNQIDSMGKVTGNVVQSLTELATAGGATSKVIGGGVDIIKSFVKEMAGAADNALKLQQGYFAMAGASGQLNLAFGNAGTNLEDLNSMMMKQRTLIDQVAGSTGASAKQVAGFYQELGTAIPGAVDAQITAVDGAGRSMTGLQATMTLAAGTGRDVKSVITDMKTAFEDFSASEQDAITWTARMSDLSSRFGINLEYTQKFMKDNADAFKLISNNAGDADATFNRMFESFKQTGLSAKQSSEIIGQLTGSLAHLSTAQKAFLSAQSGGPGGLRGAFHIDNMLREGKTDEVMKMAEDNLKKHFGGKIYTQKEAEGSDFAASQFMKQRQMLESGAFGSMVKPGDDATAARVLEAMQAGTSAKEALTPKENMVQQTMDRGEGLQGTTNTILNKILHEMETQRGIAENRALDTMQKYGGGTTRTDRGAAGANVADQLNQERSALMSGSLETAMKIGKKPFEGATRPLDVNAARDVNLGKFGNDLSKLVPDSFRGLFDDIRGKLGRGDASGGKDYDAEMKKLSDEQRAISKQIAAAGGVMTDAQKAQLGNIQAARAQFASLGYANVTAGRGPGSAAAVQQAQAGAGTASAAPVPRGAGRGAGAGTAGAAPTPHAQGQAHTLTINGVMCEKCHTPINTNHHIHVTTSGA